MKKRIISDEEYVEKIRKRNRTLRRMWWLWLILLLGMLYSLVRLNDIIHGIIADVPGEKKIIYTGFFLGAMLGFMFITIAGMAGLYVKEWIDALQGYRTDRLMLKYHDELKKKETPNNAVLPVVASVPAQIADIAKK